MWLHVFHLDDSLLQKGTEAAAMTGRVATGERTGVLLDCLSQFLRDGPVQRFRLARLAKAPPEFYIMQRIPTSVPHVECMAY